MTSFFNLPPWRFNPVLLKLLTFNTPEGNSGCRVRRSGLQGNWWNRSLDS